MKIEVKVPIQLEKTFDGKRVISCEEGKISEILKEISERYPDASNKIIDKNNKLRKYIKIFVDGKSISRTI